MSRKLGTRAIGHLERKHTGYWYIIVRTREKFRCMNTGTKNRDEAQKKLEEFLAESRRRLEEERAAIPLAKAWAQYENSPSACRPEERIRRKRQAAWFDVSRWMLVHHPEVDNVAGITVGIANEYMNHYREDHTASTCNNKLKLFTGMFNALERDGVVDANPWREVIRFPNDSHARRELAPEEVGRILAEAAAAGGEWRALMMVGLYTGLRRGDCCLLDWGEVDVEHMIIQVVPRKTRKYAGGMPVTIPIHPQLLAVLEETPPERRNGYVFESMADMYLNHNSMLGERIRRIFTAAGIETTIMLEGRVRPTPYATFHSLRHSFVSFATNAGVPLPVVQSIVGHHSSAMTRHYYHANEEALRKAVDAVPDFEEAGAKAFAGSEGASPSDGVEAPRCDTSLMTLLRRTRPLVERMKEAATLFREGLISDEEFSAMRRQILATA